MTKIQERTTEEIIERVRFLALHEQRMASDEGYFFGIVLGEIPDPVASDENFDPDDPWYDYAALDSELAGR